MHKGIGEVLTDVFAGAVCSILPIAYCQSQAALIFTGARALLSLQKALKVQSNEFFVTDRDTVTLVSQQG
jgi:hypothetical protein